MNLILISVIIVWLIKLCETGQISYFHKLPISNTISNCKEKTTYMFKFVLDSDLSPPGFVRIVFPEQFPADLGISSDSKYICEPFCNVKNRVVDFSFPYKLLSNTTYEARIMNVVNPQNAGGTANFYIQTMSGNRIIDENLFYGLIGVSNDIVELDMATVRFEKEGVNFAGQISIYVFEFRLKISVIDKIFIRLFFPKGTFGIEEFPPCLAISVNRKYLGGELLCQRNLNSTDYDYIDISGVAGSYGPGQTFAVKVTLANPIYEQITDEFGIALIKTFTNIIYQRKTGIKGLYIAPSYLNDVYLTPIDPYLKVTRNKQMWFRLNFKPTNFLNDGYVIRLIIPASVKLMSNFILNYPVSYYLVEGLIDISGRTIIEMQHDTSTNYVLIKGFTRKFNLDAISFDLLISTPDNVGESSPIEISTYTSELSGNLVDNDKTFAKMSVSNIQVPLDFSVDISTNIITLQPTSIDSVVFSIKPAITVPATGYIRFIFPENLQIQWIGTSQCLIQNTAAAPTRVVTTCSYIGRTILVSLQGSFYRQQTYTIELKNVVLTPQLGGIYLVDVTTLLTDKETEIESYSQEIKFVGFKLPESSARFISREKAENAFIKISFKLPLDIPKSTDGLLDGSILSISFTADATFQIAQDLNFNSNIVNGTIPCTAIGTLTPIDGDEIFCKLNPGLEPNIRISNYKSALKDSKIVILIPNFKVIDGNTKIQVSLVQKTKRQFYELATTSLAVSVNLPLSPSLVVDYSALPGNFYSLTSMDVDSDFDLWFDLKLISQIDVGQSIVIMLPSYGSGFCYSKSIQCTLQGSSLPCFCVRFVSWILIELGTYDSVSTADSYIVISGLRWPSFVNSDMGSVNVRVTTPADLTAQYYQYPKFPMANPYSFITAELVSELKRDTVDSLYTFEFILPINIQAGHKLTIDFPFIYDLTKSFPAIRVNSTELESASSQSGNSTSNAKIRPFLSSTQLILNDLPVFAANQTFHINMMGVYSPNYEFKINNFNARLLTEGNFLIAQQSNFASFYFQKPSPVAEINFSYFSVVPLNADAYGVYTFGFSIPSPLSQGTNIFVEFPEEYIYLPTQPECQVGGILKSFKQCYVSLGSIVLELDSDISEGYSSFTIKGIKNPDKGYTGYFSIHTEYDSRKTGLAVQMPFHRLKITKQAEKLTVISNKMNPSNEGEKSILTFYILPTIQVGPTMNVLVIFPRKADRSIGESLICTGVSGLSGRLQCSANEGILYIKPNDDYYPNSDIPLGIEISGVIVPNRNSQIFAEDYIAMAVKSISDNVYLNYNAKGIQLDITRAPKWLSLRSLTFSHYNCRYTANMYLNITFYSSMPKVSSGGALFVDLPSGFSISDKNVNVLSKMPSFGTNLNGHIVNNRLIISGNLQDYSGDLSLVIFKIDNPIDEVSTSAFIARSYDGNNNKIIERCYENLDPVFLDYKYPGPLIVINNDKEIVINRGTVTENIPIWIEGQTTMNLFLKANFDGLVVYPSQITLHLGAEFETFSMSVPQDFPENKYRFNWILIGEKIPKVYTPIRQQIFRVISKRPVNIKVGSQFFQNSGNSQSVSLDTGDEPINTSVTVEPSIVLPFGGKSLPIVVELENAPDIELIILLNKKKDYKGISLTQSMLKFNAKTRIAEFSIYFSNTTQALDDKISIGSVDLQLKGLNADIYQLDKNTLDFKVDPLDKTIPNLLSISIGEITKTQVQIIMKVNEICFVYYVVSFKGMQSPTFTEVFKQNLTSIAKPYFLQFGKLSIYSSEINSKILTIDQLMPQFEYVMYMYIEDTGNNISGPFSLDFKTLNRDKAADVSVKILLSFLTYNDKQDILKHIAQLLSLPAEKLQEKKYYISLADIQKTSSGRRLQAVESEFEETVFSSYSSLYNSPLNKVSVIFSFNIISSPENSAYPSPRDLGLSLSNKLNLLVARINNFDTSYTIQSSEFVSYYPRYAVEPYIIDYTWERAIIYTEFDLYGWLYGVAIVSNSTNDTNKIIPSPVQISLGINEINVSVPFGLVEISERYQGFNLTILNLIPETNYTVYLIGANAQPGYPELMDERYLISRTFRTLKAPPADFVDLGSKTPKTFAFILVCFLLLIK